MNKQNKLIKTLVDDARHFSFSTALKNRERRMWACKCKVCAWVWVCVCVGGCDCKCARGPCYIRERKLFSSVWERTATHRLIRPYHTFSLPAFKFPLLLSLSLSLLAVTATAAWTWTVSVLRVVSSARRLPWLKSGHRCQFGSSKLDGRRILPESEKSR